MASLILRSALRSGLRPRSGLSVSCATSPSACSAWSSAPSAAASPRARGYHQNIVDHYESPRNVGALDKADRSVGTGLVGAPACGDVMKLQIRVGADGRIAEAKFKTFGCGSAIASSSVATEWVKGRTVEEVLSIRNTDIAAHLKLPPVKLHCSMLAEDAIKAAVADYAKKQQATPAPAAAAAAKAAAPLA
jgi:Fe-S cluster assembly scaffold IscU